MSSIHKVHIETLKELLIEANPKSPMDTCYVVRDWLSVRSALAFELGGGDVAGILDRAAAAAVR